MRFLFCTIFLRASALGTGTRAVPERTQDNCRVQALVVAFCDRINKCIVFYLIPNHIRLRSLSGEKQTNSSRKVVSCAHSFSCPCWSQVGRGTFLIGGRMLTGWGRCGAVRGCAPKRLGEGWLRFKQPAGLTSAPLLVFLWQEWVATARHFPL